MKFTINLKSVSDAAVEVYFLSKNSDGFFVLPKVSKVSTLLKKLASSVKDIKVPANNYLFLPAGLDGSTSALFYCVNKTSFSSQDLMIIGGNVANIVAGLKIPKVNINVDTLISRSQIKTKKTIIDTEQMGLIKDYNLKVKFFGQGFLLSQYKFDHYKKLPKVIKDFNLVATKISPANKNKILKEINVETELVNKCRELQTMTANNLYPEILAKHAQKMGKDYGFNVEVFNKTKINSKGFEGLIQVGKGSERDPRFVVCEYNKSKKKYPHIALVGKGVTYDTGGYSLKPSASMAMMKTDMSGAAVVLSAISIISSLKLPVRVSAFVPSVENMISSKAYRVGDIYKSYSGKTIEVLNTDAEGRLILADALTYASEQKPDIIIDVATLTGACLVALGEEAFGVFSNSDKLAQNFVKQSWLCGERSWQLPIFNAHINDMKGKISDLKNTGSNRYAGASKAAAFLYQFIDQSIPWVHLDIAGVDMGSKAQGSFCPPNIGTGVGAKAIVEFVRSQI